MSSEPETRSPTLTRIIRTLSWLLFEHRQAMLAAFGLITVGFAISVSQLGVDAGFRKMVPFKHPYMQTFFTYESTFGGANPIIVALVKEEGDIYTPEFMASLKGATDDLFFIPGIDRPTVQSLFTPNTRFTEVVEGGFSGGTVIPDTYQGAPEDLAEVRDNIEKSGVIGRLVANDQSGALIRANLLDVNPDTGEKLSYPEVAQALEELRAKYQKDGVTVHIIGFAKAVGDIAEGTEGVIAFFGIAFLITAVLLFLYSKSTPLTLVALVCALLPVLWLLGALPLLGYGIDPMSILVPFLIFSIGCSHAVQMTNAWRNAVLEGHDGLQASKVAFAELLIPGSLALLTNALGFLVIMLIPIQIVRELGITATLGVSLMIITNKMVLPILLSYLKLDPATLQREKAQESRIDGVWRSLARFADRRHATYVIILAVGLAILGGWRASDMVIGDIGEGLPELRPESRYNRDNAVITSEFAIGVDILSVIVQTREIDGACTVYEVMDAIDAFEWRLANVPGVASTLSLQTLAQRINAGWNEGNIKWRTLPRNEYVLAQSVSPVDTGTGLLNPDCSAMQVLLFLDNHRADTLKSVVQTIKDWNVEFKSDPRYAPIASNVDFLLASGNAGVMAATNEAVHVADRQQLAAIFSAIALMCLVTFRSFAAMVCIVVPLALVSLLNNALMATLGIGLKVSTLPVVALGVGVGVDYGIYLYDRLEVYLKRGVNLEEAFFHALKERGAAAVFTAVTMSLGVFTWAFSALKLQADMGLLLSFMFLVNMLGAVFLLPSLLAYLTRNPEHASPPLASQDPVTTG